MRPSRPFVLAIVLIAMAGCLEQADNSRPSPDGNSPGDSQGSPPGRGNSTTPPHLVDLFAGSDCHGVHTTFDAPGSWFSDEVPAEWRYTGPATRHYGFIGYECQRIGLPWLERGPAALLIEFHANAVPPEACTGPGGETLRIVRGIYTNDAEIANAFNESLGMAPILGQIELVLEPVAAGEAARYQWTTEHGLSSVEVVRMERDLPTFDLDEVWLGLGESGPWRAEFKGAATLFDSSQPGLGTMSKETLHARLYGSDWAGTTGNYGNVNFSAEVTKFTGLSCEEEA